MKYSVAVLVLLFGTSVCVLGSEEQRSDLVEKRSFTDLGCMGEYDRPKFSRLNRVCEECYQLYRESDVHTECRSNCFKNTMFILCVDALLLKKDQQNLEKMVEVIYGK